MARRLRLLWYSVVIVAFGSSAATAGDETRQLPAAGNCAGLSDLSQGNGNKSGMIFIPGGTFNMGDDGKHQRSSTAIP